MPGNVSTKCPTVAAMFAAGLLAVALGGCASATDPWRPGLAANAAGTRMGLPIPPCDACAPAREKSPAQPCAEDCLGMCCKY